MKEFLNDALILDEFQEDDLKLTKDYFLKRVQGTTSEITTKEDFNFKRSVY